MRYFIDTEFIEDGKTIDLISIGIVAENGRELYMQSSKFSPMVVSEWVRENVLPQLTLCPHKRYQGKSTVFGDHIDHYERGQCIAHVDCPWRTRAQIKAEILSFMDISKYGKPELWGYYSAYDHVVFCQLFGTMMDLPEGFPIYTNDLQQSIEERYITSGDLPDEPENQHNALADARWVRDAWMAIYR